MLPKKGLVALVNGGASGLNEASVKELFKQQCKVVIAIKIKKEEPISQRIEF